MGKSNKTGKSKKDKTVDASPGGGDLANPNIVPVGVPIGPVIGNRDKEARTQSVPGGAGQNLMEEEEYAETSTAAAPEKEKGDAGTVDGGNATAVPSAQALWDSMKLMMTQLATLTGVVNQVGPGGLASATVVQPEVVEIDPPIVKPAKKKVDYLSILGHISKLGTKQFHGSADPIEADEWKSRLIRNFNSTRCPEDYRKDIAVHFLEGDAHNWWLAVEKRMGGRECTFANFEAEFGRKYFPSEAWDRLEGQFLSLCQGTKSVREYEEEFNRLRRYVGRELEDEQSQLRRFIRGLRVDIRIHCAVRTFSSVSELVERAAMIELDLAEEKEKEQGNQTRPNPKTNEKKRKFDKVGDGVKSASKRTECASCGKKHGGECWKASGACLRCGSKDHGIQNCPRMEQGPKVTSDGDKTCYNCGLAGHFKRECPKLQVGQGGQKGNRGGSEPQAKRQAGAPRVYELSKEAGAAGNFNTITGKSLAYSFL